VSKILPRKFLEHAGDYIRNNCNPLYDALFAFHFGGGGAEAVVSGLERFRNGDGGFGHGLEHDFLMPDSSPMATTVALQIFREVGVGTHPIIDDALDYFQRSFDRDARRWWAVPQAVNDHPHAPWWHADEQSGLTVIDANWGNPGAEIIGYLYAGGKSTGDPAKAELLDSAAAHLSSIDTFASEHELYCYIRMFEMLDVNDRRRFYEPIVRGIRQLVCLDAERWNEYLPRPLDFVSRRSHPLFEVVEPWAGSQLDYLIDTCEDGLWYPTWEWGQYEEAWQTSKKNWTAKITIGNLLILRDFGRLS
jgi:hypothetical protein